MLVRDIMSSPAVSIPPAMTLEDAYRIMQERDIRHLPVLDKDRLVGVITDRDLRLATSTLAPSPLSLQSRVSEVMNGDPMTAEAADPVEDVAFRMRQRKIGCLPVMDDGQLIGIITGLDLLDALLRMTGVDKPSGRLEVRLPDHPGELARLTSFLSHRDLNVHSILTYPESRDSLRAVLRIGSIEIRALANDLRLADFEVLWPPEKPCPR
ncbi:MAG: CBS and ACT domain-containing protein [Isosphaeraceae bacterium]